ncbi:hypothetical protein Elgi_36880 [Paenibacillus elgii]|uniref:hypothetical protein n=1 Tax=Paenibacillus elgii TaxID=189691 RepID=UPI002D7DC554|nr:hypothetical protein Elgi_36880 [Paenibacillus elgii]
MNYEEAKAYREKLEEKNKDDSNALKEFNKHYKSAMGLTPDHVKALPEWKLAKKVCDASFTELRNFNEWFVKTFKKEYAADRRKRNPTK